MIHRDTAPSFDHVVGTAAEMQEANVFSKKLASRLSVAPMGYDLCARWALPHSS